jgi:hypothetical protein
MSLYEHIEIHTATQHFIDIKDACDIVVYSIFQPIGCEFEFVNQRVGLVLNFSIVETTPVERPIDAPVKSIGVCFEAR